MEPYYADDWVTLYHGDCLEITDWLSADVLVTDPPYGIGWRIGDGLRSGNGLGIQNDLDTTSRDTVLALWGTRPGVVFGTWRASFPDNKQVLVWQKSSETGVIGATTGYRRDTELVFLVGKWSRCPVRRSSVLSGYPGGQSYLSEGHPHAKPVSLLRDLIEPTTGTVADPFAGSGSTLVAAKALGRKAIGVEIEERYCEITANRLAQDVLDFEQLLA